MNYTRTESDLDTESSLRPCRKCLCRLSGLAPQTGVDIRQITSCSPTSWIGRRVRLALTCGCGTYLETSPTNDLICLLNTSPK